LGSAARELLCSFEYIILQLFFLHINCALALRFMHLMGQVSLPLLWGGLLVNSFVLKMCLGVLVCCEMLALFLAGPHRVNLFIASLVVINYFGHSVCCDRLGDIH
jgi:hypothetical protein